MTNPITHPEWCDRALCDAQDDGSDEHRSTPALIAEWRGERVLASIVQPAGASTALVAVEGLANVRLRSPEVARVAATLLALAHRAGGAR